MNALIFAAGRGERLRPFTDKIAKPAIPFLNVPMMGYPIFYLEKAGVKNFIFNTHHLPATIESSARQLCGKRAGVLFSPEQPEILGSGGGLAKAVSVYPQLAKDDLLIANADMVALYENPQVVTDLLRRHRESGALATLLVCPFPNAKESFGGVYADTQGQVRRFSKTALTDPNLKPWHFAGFMVVSPLAWQGLSTQPSNLFYDIFQKKIDQGGKVIVLTVPATAWYETGNLKDYLASTEAALKLLATPSPTQRTLIQILDRFTPGWWKGWRTMGEKSDSYLLCSLPWPDRIKVTGFAVVGPQALLGSQVHVNRSVISGEVTLKDSAEVQHDLILSSANA
ncbi:MAG: NDP-sugar synthase [Bdellovibrionales bacterium]